MDIFGTDIWFSDCRFAGVPCLILWFNARFSLLCPTRSTPDQSLRVWSHTWNFFGFYFWRASKYFFYPNHNHLLFSACLPSRMFSPIHPYSVWPALSLQVCVCEQPASQSEAPWAHADLCWIFDPVSKTSQAPKHSHAPFCKLIAHCAIQEPEHSAF